ncbi:MAG: Gfo/Idh/MocA family oxidoreductase [Bacteroidota bacterium]|nr:Gfo/Idh/MocA family oxidoreductase [Bacteroidota bacterium]
MKQYNRRRFLQAAGATVLIAPLHHVSSGAGGHNGRKLNIALCGLGVYAQILADGITASKFCRLSGIVTGTPAKAASWKKKYNIPDSNIYNYSNFDQLAGNKDIDLVYVVLPNSMHKEYTIRAARAGKHVITEKPMATNAADCEAMISACREAGVQLGVGYRLHFEPYNMEMKRLGQEKVFGQVRLMEISLGYKADDGTGWRTHRALSGGGPLMNLGVYCVQAARYVSGEEPIAVTAQFNPIVNKEVFAEVEASITWQLEFPSGAICNSTSTYTAGVDRLFASAEKGFFELSPAISYGPFRGRTSEGTFQFPEINQQAAQLDAMAATILAGKPLPAHISGEEGWKDCRIMDAIYQAAKSGQKVYIG